MVIQLWKCLNHLRQCAVGTITYATENNEHQILYRTKGGNIKLWSYFIAFGYNVNDQASGVRYITPPVRVCPESQYYSADANSTNRYNISYAAYLGNGYDQLYGYGPYYKRFSISSQLAIGVNVHNEMTEPGKEILFGDSYSGHPSTPNGGGHMIGNFKRNGSSNWGGYLMTQHQNACNTVFADGHAISALPGYLRTQTNVQPQYILNHKAERYYYDNQGVGTPSF